MNIINDTSIEGNGAKMKQFLHYDMLHMKGSLRLNLTHIFLDVVGLIMLHNFPLTRVPMLCNR